jgi:predicted nucleic acid-binding protein
VPPLSAFAGEAIYLDAMLLVGLIDAGSPWHPAARALFVRALEPGRPPRLVTATLTLDEVLFVLLQELVSRPPHGVVRSRSRYLADHPEVVRWLAATVEAPLQGLLDLLALEPVLASDVVALPAEMAASGLLPRDAIHVAVMRRLGITALASDDAAFDRCPGVRRFAP